MKFKTSVPLKQRYTKTLSGFRGVDLSSSPLDVAPSRATEACNLILQNGVNRKRNGWEELFKLEGRINGIFPFDEGDTRVLLVHAGTNLWRVEKGEGAAYKKTRVNGEIVLTDTPSQCFYQNGTALLVGCGTYLAYGKHGIDEEYTLKPVSEIAYVPTTRYTYLREIDESFSVESVNLLTDRRKNKFFVQSEKIHPMYLDSEIADGTVNVRILTSKGDFTISLTVENGEAEAEDLSYYNYEWRIKIHRFIQSGSGGYVQIYIDGDIENTAGIKEVVVEFGTNSGSAARIDACKCGTLFGVDGASDRLFLSGNPGEPNKDFFSEAGDFTYFPDGNVLTVGGSDAAIMGYARLSDATLAIFKEEAMGSPSVFYRTGKEITVKDYDGHDMPAPLFPTVPGTTGEHLMRSGAVANLLGDVLFLSKNGVFGVELSSNVSSTERYAIERSRAIYEDLRKRDLSNAVCTVFRGRYYLALGDKEGTCYVADAHYRAAFEGADTGYEWWVWKNIPATCFAIFEDALIFGTAEGRVCGFHDGYVDRYETEIAAGAGEVNQSGERLTFDTALGIKTGDEVKLSGKLYALLIEECTVQNGVIQIEAEDLKLLTERLYVGAAVYADNVGESGLAPNTPYTVLSLDPGALTLTLEDADGKEIALSCGGFRLSLPLQGVTCRIGETSGAYATLCDVEGAPYRLVAYNGEQASGFVAKYLHRSPVVASWTSPVMDLGSNMHRKTLLGLSVVLGTYSEGAVRFGFETSDTAFDSVARGAQLLDFDKLDFDNFSFAANRFTRSYTKRLNKRNFNYIRVTYRSEDDADCAVEGITLYYKINQMNRGLY
ncbi:MAG: hypothetical protein IJC99_04215 [Clostridia bacterium]|nr:hypothetical protein [Clostridia bacterium]